MFNPPKNNQEQVTPSTVNSIQDVKKSFIKEYNEKNYKIGESLINTYSTDDNSYYLCTISYPTIVNSSSYIQEMQSFTSNVSLQRYDVFVNNPTIKGEPTSETKVEPTSELKLNYNLTRSLNNNYTNKTNDSIDVKQLSREAIEIVNIINSYMTTIELKSMRNNHPGENIVYTAEDLADIEKLIVEKKILLKNPDIITNVVPTVVEIKYIYMEPEKKGGKRTSRRARKSKKSIRKSKLRRRHRK
jgi:hypothetical protein